MGPPDIEATELLASENRLRVLLGLTKGIVFEFDREARYLAAWTHDQELLARPVEDMLGRTIEEILGEAGKQFTAAIARVYETGKPETIVYELEVQGGVRWFSADVVVSPEVPGRDRTIVYLVRDITAQKLLEHQVAHAQRVEAVGQLAGSIAHDFTNILTTIVGYSEMLLESLDGATLQHTHATRIRNAAARASALTGQLLAFGQKRVYVPEAIDLNAMLAGMRDMLQRVLGTHIVLRVELDPALGHVHTDRAGLEQVILNLTLNARDALGGIGTFELRTEASPDGQIALIAIDDGCGMTDEIKARIFEPFFTTKPQGSGLGLSTIAAIVQQAGGTIEVTTAPTAGTRFMVRWPVVTDR